MIFAEKLIKARVKSGFTQKALADKLHISVQTYNGYETKGYEPKFEVLLNICTILDTSPNELIGYVQQSGNAKDYAKLQLDNFRSYDKDTIEYRYQTYEESEEWGGYPLPKEKIRILLPKQKFEEIIEVCYMMAEIISIKIQKDEKSRIFKKHVESSVLQYYLEQHNKTVSDAPTSETGKK